MAKTPSIRLFRLINSLSGSEKRYFKLYINEHGKKNSKYMLLFQEMDNMSEFDEEKLKNIVYEGKQIESRKYSELKSYLYDLILKSLHAYDEQSSVDYKLKGMLQSIRSLYKRSLFEDCHILILKTEKLAQKYEDFKVVIELQGWKRQVAYAENDIGFLDAELEKINKIENKAIAQLENILAYKKAFFQLYVSIRKNPEEKSKSETEKESNLLTTLLLKDEKQAQSHLALIRFYRIQSIYHYSKGNFVNFFEESKKIIQIMEQQVHFLKEDLSEYISTLSNLGLSGFLVKDYKEVQRCLDKLQSLNPLTLDDKTKIHRQYYAIKFRLCILLGDFEEGVIALNLHLKEVENLDKKLFERDGFLFQYFYIQFGAENYNEALDYLNRWLNLSKRVERQDLWITARIVNLILHYEMGNTLLLDSLIRSTYRYLSKNKTLSIYENKVLAFFRDILKMQDKKQIQKVFVDFKAELQKEKYKQSHPRVFNMDAWLDAKIQQRKFRDIVRERFYKENPD